MAKILIVEDDQSIGQEVKKFLEQDNYSVEWANDGRLASDMLRVYQYDVIVLDWDLPFKPGIDVLKEFRQRGGKTPVIMLTGKTALEEKEKGLDTGADDYLTKPFLMKELTARLRALIRRTSGASSNLLKAGKLELDPSSFHLTSDGTELHLQPKEFALLEFFMRHPGNLFTGQVLLDCIWSSDSTASPNTVKSYMYSLRKKLAAAGHGELIETVHGFGYRLNENT